jgi:hypothetical protein
MHEHADSPVPTHTSHYWEVGAVAATAAIISAPYVLPLLGVGDESLVKQIASICGSAQGGLAQGVEGLLGKVPLIGSTLASAGWGASITSGVIGLGGMWLGDYIHSHYDTKDGIPWGSVIKYTARATSALIALPSILSGISMGLTFLANVMGGFDAGEWMRKALTPTLGFSGVAHSAPTGLAALVPHLFTCGRTLLPISIAAMGALRGDEPVPEMPARDGRIIPLNNLSHVERLHATRQHVARALG